MSTVLPPTYANLSLEFHEINAYDLIESNYSLDIRQYFMENFQRFLDDCEILSKTDLINLDGLLTLLNSINNNTQFSKEMSDKKLPFLDILITKSDKQVWMNIFSKQPIQNTVFYNFNLPKPCFKTIPFVSQGASVL